MLLAQRPPSVNWEPLPLNSTGQSVVWVWYRPAVAPYGLMFVIPARAFDDPTTTARLTVRQLVAVAGIDQEAILYWSLNGMSFDSNGGTSPLMDQQLPSTLGSNLELSVWINPSPSAQPFGGLAPYPGTPVSSAEAIPVSRAGGASESDNRHLEAIESYWNAILQLEVRIGSIRKELGSNVSRLNSLNRDLNSDERRTCDSKDIQAWADARRWLRDSLSTLARSVKEIDVGTTSGAGQRHKFEEIYRKYVIPRIPFAGMAQTVNDFEAHHKRVQTVLASAQANIARSGREAEQRANSVLARISTKMRSIRRKD